MASIIPDLKVDEVAELLRIHPETIRVWLRTGRFPHAYRLSRRAGWRVPHADVEALREPGQACRSGRPWPKSIASYDGPVLVHGEDIEEYMREHWRPEWK